MNVQRKGSRNVSLRLPHLTTRQEDSIALHECDRLPHILRQANEPDKIRERLISADWPFFCGAESPFSQSTHQARTSIKYNPIIQPNSLFVNNFIAKNCRKRKGLVDQTLFESLCQLVRTGGGAEAALDPVKPRDCIFHSHSYEERGHTLCVAGTPAGEDDLLDDSTLDIDVYFSRTNTVWRILNVFHHISSRSEKLSSRNTFISSALRRLCEMTESL